MHRLIILFSVPFFLFASCHIKQSSPAEGNRDSVAIIISPEADNQEKLAAKEVRRYIYLRTGTLPEIQAGDDLTAKGNLILIANKDHSIIKGINSLSGAASLKDQQYILKTVSDNNRKILVIAGGDSIGTLYGSYKFAEHLGVRFYLHGDVVPDEQQKFSLPDVNETGKPLFELRGIHPFHDFPEGPDWWNLDDYKAVFAQLPKLRMNFFSLHTYPQSWVGPEPLVWIGLEDDIAQNGNVKSAYPSRHMTTMTNQWGYRPVETSFYYFGAADIFERDDYGTDYMIGVNPWNKAPAETQTKLFNDMGKFLGDAFSFAKALGIKTCIGTETPLTIPTAVKKRLLEKGIDPNSEQTVQKLYEGMFARIKKTHPLDYYWFWTPEDWTWGGNTKEDLDKTVADLQAAVKAAKNVGAPFTLGTCGWVLGPRSDRSMFDRLLPKDMFMSCISRDVGIAQAEKGFIDINGRPKWSIPWLEDDPAILIPQLWAGRMRKDAADSLAYGCTGLMGIHWRTKVLSPNVSALAYAAWEQAAWNPNFNQPFKPQQISDRRLGGLISTFTEPVSDTNDDAIYQDVIYDLDGYLIKVPSGVYKVTLQFNEPHYNETGKRIFGVKLQGQTVIESLDMYQKAGKNKAIDYTFENVNISDGVLKIDFIRIVEFPCIAGMVIERKDAATNTTFVRKINCGGTSYKDYEPDLPSIEEPTGPRDLPCSDFYLDWAKANFGPQAAEQIGKLFARLDGGNVIFSHSGSYNANLPRPSTWIDGPGGIKKDNRPWSQIQNEYAFVNEMEALRTRIIGAGNIEQFDYWLNNFRYIREVGRFACLLSEYDAVMEKVRKMDDADEKKKLAEETALPVRKQLIKCLENANRYLLETVGSPGEMGNVCNWQSHLIPMYITTPGNELAQILGRALPADAVPSKSYSGTARLFVPTVRTSLAKGEFLLLKPIILGAKPESADLYFRSLGEKNFQKITLSHINRGVYSAVIPADKIRGDFEYYVKVSTDKGDLLFPASAPEICQSVVLMP